MMLTKRAGRKRLADVGLDVVQRKPLIVCCQWCDAEWMVRYEIDPRSGKPWWYCLNGCNDFALAENTRNA